MGNMAAETPPANVDWLTPDEYLEELAERYARGEFAEELGQMRREYWENVRRAGRPVPEEEVARYFT